MPAGRIRAAVRWFDRLASHRWLSILTPGVLIVLLRLALLPVAPVPEPMAPDEFSQLLAAKTFASGRLANPTPPFQVHFEAPYVLMQPTYASKYPPGPPLLMALGIATTGFAWAGVLLGAGLMCSGLCWMLQGWVPPRWALAGAMLAVGRYSLHHYWLNSYWGGFLAGFGGALVLGALPRILRSGQTGPAVVMAVGMMVLLASRPYEGVLFSLVPGIVVLVWAVRSAMRQRLVAVVAPMVVVGVTAAIPYALYNWRVTGSPAVLPYAAYTAQYEPVPHFIWQSGRNVRPFNHSELQDYLSFPGFVERQRSLRAAGSRVLEVIGIPATISVHGVNHPAAAVALVSGLALMAAVFLVFRDRKMRIPLIMLAVFVAGLLPETFFYEHYAAPAAGLMFLVLVQGLRHVSLWQFWRKGPGRLLPSVLSLAVVATIAVYGIFLAPQAIHDPGYIKIDRPRVSAHVCRMPGKHLILMRFGPGFSIHEGDWIYNEPDLDSARVIWARDMGDLLNKRLLEHFSDRQVWYVYKDRGPARIYRAGTVREPALTSAGSALVRTRLR
jgi:hypothetical protein